MNQNSLFDIQSKGSAEWSTFTSVRHDTVGTFRVASTPREGMQRSTIVGVRKFAKPHQLFPKPVSQS